MWLEQMTHLGALVTEPATLVTALAGAMGVVLRQRRRFHSERVRAVRVQEELMAYLLLDDWQTGDARAMGRRICRAIGRHSAFGASALLIADEQGRLRVMASTRTDELTVRALERWAEAQQVYGQEAIARADEDLADTGRAARRSRLVRLERRSGYEPGNPAALAWCTALIVPMATDRGEVSGAIAVCADRFHARPAEAIAAALRPLELLAARFAAGAAGLRAKENGEELDTSEPVNEVSADENTWSGGRGRRMEGAVVEMPARLVGNREEAHSMHVH